LKSVVFIDLSVFSQSSRGPEELKSVYTGNSENEQMHGRKK